MALQTLNASVIANLPLPDRGQKLVWDSKLKGFGIRLTKTAKTFICESRVKGRTRRVSICSVGVLTVAEARKRAQQELGRMAAGVDPNTIKAEHRARSMTLSEAISDFFNSRKLKPSTEYDYRRVFRVYFGDWSNRELRSISPNDFLSRFRKTTHNSGEATANKSARIFQSMWNFTRAATSGPDGIPVLPECPVNRVGATKSWHKTKRRHKHLLNSQYPIFFAGLDKVRSETKSNRHKDAGPMLADFAELILRTGLRKMEAATLEWSSVNFQNCTFTIGEDRAKNGNELVLPMSNQVQAILERRNKARGASAYVFPGEGKSRTLGDPRKTLEQLRKAVGDPELGFHDLRRSFAVQCERQDISHSKIKRLLNHADGGDVTMGYLVSTDPERLRKPVQQISDEIDRLAKQV